MFTIKESSQVTSVCIQCHYVGTNWVIFCYTRFSRGVLNTLLFDTSWADQRLINQSSQLQIVECHQIIKKENSHQVTPEIQKQKKHLLDLYHEGRTNSWDKIVFGWIGTNDNLDNLKSILLWFANLTWPNL